MFTDARKKRREMDWQLVASCFTVKSSDIFCSVQLIPGTAGINLLSYRNSNSFQTWPCRYNYVHTMTSHITSYTCLVIALASQYFKSALYNELASRYYELAARYCELASR